MRTAAAVTIALIIASAAHATGRHGISDSARLASFGAAKAAEAYIAPLSSPNTGVVESALAHVARIKLIMPDCTMRSVKATVASIERNGATEELRYKAWVVRMVMDNPAQFAGIPKSGNDEPDALFALLAGRLAERPDAN
jgi:hypothetical protein